MSQHRKDEAVKMPKGASKAISSTAGKKKRKPFCEKGEYSSSKAARNILKVLDAFYDAQGLAKDDKEGRQALSTSAAKVLADMCIKLADEYTQAADELARKVGKQTIGKEEVITAFVLGYHGEMKKAVRDFIEQGLAKKAK